MPTLLKLLVQYSIRIVCLNCQTQEMIPVKNRTGVLECPRCRHQIRLDMGGQAQAPKMPIGLNPIELDTKFKIPTARA